MNFSRILDFWQNFNLSKIPKYQEIKKNFHIASIFISKKIEVYK